VGNVHLSHDKADLYSRRATWYRSTGLVQFVDSVLVKDENRQITSQMMTYYRRDRRITAVGDVKMIDFKEDAILTCQKAEYFRTTKQVKATGLPVLIFNPQNDTSRMEIRSGSMDYFVDDALGTAYDSVVIIRNDMTARGGKAEFRKEPEGAVLTLSPVIIQKENQVSGDTISIFTDNNKIQRLLVRGHAETFYKALPDTQIQEYTTAELKGKEQEAFFANDKIEKLVTRYNATSLYQPAATDTLVRGTNTASGDSITLYFDSGVIDRVLISGGARGEYIEPKFDDEGKPYFDTTRYSGEEIDYSFSDSEIKLFKKGSLQYHDMTLKAGDIRYSTSTKILTAQGIAADSAAKESEPPVLKQGSEELFGERMSYNLDSRRGQVRMARTKYEGGYYTGQAIRQASEDVLFVSQGNYTSCDLEQDPHYHFHSQKMKMIGRDKVVARPVILVIGDLPVFAVPYYVFPVRKGRHSGFLTFELGNFERGERFIRNVGYYWAASQYWDLQSSFDFYENQRTLLNGVFRYELRYVLSGDLGINYERSARWNRSTYLQQIGNRWRFNFRHNHVLSPTARIAGSGTFVSDKNFIADNIYDPSERLNRTLRSNLNLSKEFKGISSSMTVVASQDWNLDTDEKRELLPSIDFSRRQLPLFPTSSEAARKVRIRPGEERPEPGNMFYRNIYYSISSSFQNTRNRLRTSDSTFVRKDYQIMNNRGSLSLSQKILGALTLEPSVNLSQTVVRLERNVTTDTTGLEASKVVSRETYSLSVGARTVLYGTVAPNIFGITGLRHSLTPSVSYTFRPEVKGNQPYFSYTGAGGESRRAKEMAFRVSNLFQSKYMAGGEERKADLFSLDFASGYNFAADSLKVANLSTSFRTLAIRNLSVTSSMIHSFYDYQRAKRRPLLQPRLTSLTISTSFTIRYFPRGGKKEEGPDTGEGEKLSKGAARSTSQAEGAGFDLAISHSYTESRGAITNKSQWLNVTAQVQPTKNWKIGYNVRYGLKDRRIESQQVDIGRDLHCWEGTFTWIPLGPVAGYYFKINIKTLPDIKIEQSQGGYSGRTGRF
jgi:lipopolysaccharide assembly outer membrane protein LptD (OstA)